MIVEECDNRFYVRESTIPGAGRGLFAKAPMASGDKIEVIGILIATGSVSDECTHYADQYKFRVGSNLLVPLGYGGMVNHSSSPNTEKVIEGETVYLRVVQPVAVDEELFFSYSEYAQQRFGLL